jgi:hypothetical protein
MIRLRQDLTPDGLRPSQSMIVLRTIYPTVKNELIDSVITKLLGNKYGLLAKNMR